MGIENCLLQTIRFVMYLFSYVKENGYHPSVNVASHRKLLLKRRGESSGKVKNGKYFLYSEGKKIAEKIMNQRYRSKKRIKVSGEKKMILRKICAMARARKQFRTCSTYKEAHALATVQFYGLLEQ